MSFEITSRYGTTLEPFPNLKNICKGQCEGTGFVPIHEQDHSRPWRGLWLAAEKKKHSTDGWHFVKCPDCKGTGKRKGGAS